jgi:O-antigen/teichoic acid export membrane protein
MFIPLMVLIFERKNILFDVPNILNFIAILQEGIPYLSYTVVNEFFIRTDVILVMLLFTPTELGLYTLSISIAMLLSAVSNSVGTVTFAKSAQLNQKDRYNSVTRAFRIALVIKISAGIILAIIAKIAIPVLYGKEFIPCTIMCQILIIGEIFSGLGTILDECLLGSGFPGKSIKTRILSTVLLITVTFMLYKSIGIYGAICGYVFSKMIHLLSNMRYVTKCVDGIYLKDLLGIRRSDIKVFMEVPKKVWLMFFKNKNVRMVN